MFLAASVNSRLFVAVGESMRFLTHCWSVRTLSWAVEDKVILSAVGLIVYLVRPLMPRGFQRIFCMILGNHAVSYMRAIFSLIRRCSAVVSVTHSPVGESRPSMGPSGVLLDMARCCSCVDVRCGLVGSSLFTHEP